MTDELPLTGNRVGTLVAGCALTDNAFSLAMSPPLGWLVLLTLAIVGVAVDVGGMLTDFGFSMYVLVAGLYAHSVVSHMPVEGLKL